MNTYKSFCVYVILAFLLYIGQSLAQTTGTDAYESSFRKSLLEVINSSCGNPPSAACVNNSNEVKNTVRQVCGAVQGQDRSRCVEIANETASKAITSSIALSPNQSALQPSPQSRGSQAKSEEAREIEAIEQKRQAEIKIEKERQVQRALKEEQDKRQRAQFELEKKQREVQLQQEAESKARRESEQAASQRAKDEADRKIAKEKDYSDKVARVSSALQSRFYRNTIEEHCSIMWDDFKKSTEYYKQQAVRKSSSRELCTCTKEWLPKNDITHMLLKDDLYEKIEAGMKKGKIEDLSAQNQGVYSLLSSAITMTYTACANDFAKKGN
jgi:hypothetical protein